MSSVKINERILEGITKNSGGDEVIKDFLINLIYEEADHPGQWWRWKDTYKKLIDSCSIDWEVGDEN